VCDAAQRLQMARTVFSQRATNGRLAMARQERPERRRRTMSHLSRSGTATPTRTGGQVGRCANQYSWGRGLRMAGARRRRGGARGRRRAISGPTANLARANK
jgi:hypothetical protein